MSWLIPRQELTTDQLRAIEAPINEPRIVVGAPGSGKTQVLLHRTRYFFDEYAISPEKVRVFVFTNVLKEYIKSALADLRLPDQVLFTFDDWCAKVHEAELGRLPWSTQTRGPDFDAIRQRVRSHVTGKPPRYDAVLVDEGQDLSPACFDILKAIAKHVTVCIDHKQQIYDAGSSEQQICQSLGIKRSKSSLLDAFRCCPHIVRVASEFVADSDERRAYLNQSRMPQVERQTPLVYEAIDAADETRQLQRQLSYRLAAGDKGIAILFFQNRHVYGYAEGLRSAGFEVETWDRRDRSGLNFANGIPKVVTWNSAKGLTFDSVLIPRLVPNAFGPVTASRREKLLYVAVTRATRWVYMSTCVDRVLPELERLRLVAGSNAASLVWLRGDRSDQSERATAAGAGDDLL